MCLRYMHKDHHSNPWQTFHQIRFTNRVEFWAGHLWEGFADEVGYELQNNLDFRIWTFTCCNRIPNPMEIIYYIFDIYLYV